MLRQTQLDLEVQIQKVLQIQKNEARKGSKPAGVGQRIEPNNDGVMRSEDAKDKEIQELKTELSMTQRDLAKEVSMSKQREIRLQRALEKCEKYEIELEELSQHRPQQQYCGEMVSGDLNKSTNAKDCQYQYLIKNLEHQRSELLVVVKKQMKLIDILKQQRVHAQAATLLNMIEKDFMKELDQN